MMLYNVQCLVSCFSNVPTMLINDYWYTYLTDSLGLLWWIIEASVPEVAHKVCKHWKTSFCIIITAIFCARYLKLFVEKLMRIYIYLTSSFHPKSTIAVIELYFCKLYFCRAYKSKLYFCKLFLEHPVLCIYVYSMMTC